MRWLKDEPFYITVLLLLILIMAIRTPLDSDMWWHLRAGEETWQSGNVYRVDTLSYTREGETWINHSWLAQVIMIGLYRIGGYKALSLWVGLSAVISMYFVYFQMKELPILRMGVVLLAAFVSSVVWSPRPQIFSLVFFGLVGLILYRHKWLGKDQLIWLLPIFIVWSNLHGGYILGVILIGAFVLGELINKLIGIESESALSMSKIGKLTMIGIAGFALSAVNPNGIDMWKIPFQTVGVESLQNLIQEWASPDFHQPIQQIMLILMFGTFAAVGLSKKTLDGVDLAGFSIFGVLALTGRRNFGPFAMVAAPILSRHLEDIFESWKLYAEKKWSLFQKLNYFQKESEEKINRTLQLTINVMVLLAMVFLAGYKWISVNNREFIEGVEKQIFPVDAVEWLSEELPSGRLFSTYNWGGYLTWNLRDYQVFVDGRTDLFGDEIINEWEMVISTDEGWQEVLDKWQVKIILINQDLALVSNLQTAHWSEVFRDETSVVFIRE